MTIRKVTIAGAGNVGSALARNLIRHGIDVQLAASDLAKAREAADALGERARAVDLAALRDGVDALFLAVPADAAPAVLEAARALPDGTIAVDCTNPLRWDNGPVHTPPPEGSMAAHLARRFPRLRLIKAFNTFGAEFHERPELGTAAAGPHARLRSGRRRPAAQCAAPRVPGDPVDPPRHRRQARPQLRLQDPHARVARLLALRRASRLRWISLRTHRLHQLIVPPTGLHDTRSAARPSSSPLGEATSWVDTRRADHRCRARATGTPRRRTPPNPGTSRRSRTSRSSSPPASARDPPCACASSRARNSTHGALAEVT
ncbi:MAG: hypothetical protein E6J91_30030 [Deltaproteobacteria bacterium]|nr:MAG: hypothetical protein E6J91_30030 [Deltaproteobacteria bacterium]